MTLTIRPYRPDDRASCMRIFYRAVREGTKGYYDEAQRAAWAPDDRPDPESQDRLLDQWCRVAEREGRTVGFMSLDHTGYLDMAFVLPEEMGRGTAAELYAKLLAQARAAGLRRMTVHASHLARRFFVKHGWWVVWMENHVEDGLVFERFFMACEIGEGPDDAG